MPCASSANIINVINYNKSELNYELQNNSVGWVSICKFMADVSADIDLDKSDLTCKKYSMKVSFRNTVREKMKSCKLWQAVKEWFNGYCGNKVTRQLLCTFCVIFHMFATTSFTMNYWWIAGCCMLSQGEMKNMDWIQAQKGFFFLQIASAVEKKNLPKHWRFVEF